jgi:hypothetical protein
MPARGGPQGGLLQLILSIVILSYMYDEAVQGV